jgi:hypothetical protein
MGTLPFANRRWHWFSALMLVLSFVFQAIGYTDTCSQGAADGFFTGAILSLPLLIGYLVILYVSNRKNISRSKRNFLSPYVFAACISFGILLFNREVIARLVLGLSACGLEYAESATHEIVLIGASYGLLPTFTFIGNLMLVSKQAMTKH